MTRRDIEKLLAERTTLQAKEALSEIPALLPGERMKNSGYLFPEHEKFVQLVASALRGDLFPDIPFDPDLMVERLARSDAHLVNYQMLQLLADRSKDAFLRERALSVSDALDVVRQVRAQGKMPFPPPGHDDRREALADAEEVLAKRQAHIRRVGGRRAAAALAAGETPAPERPRPSPQALAAREAEAVAIEVQVGLAESSLEGAISAADRAGDR